MGMMWKERTDVMWKEGYNLGGTDVERAKRSDVERGYKFIYIW
jgi:hypothetical protein